jgi:hypothetical protein
MPASKLRTNHKERLEKRAKATKIEMAKKKKEFTDRFSKYMEDHKSEMVSEEYIASKKEAIEVTEHVKKLAETIGWEAAEEKTLEDFGQEKMDRVRDFILKEKLRDVN